MVLSSGYKTYNQKLVERPRNTTASVISCTRVHFKIHYSSEVSFQSSNLISRAVTRSQTSLGIKASFRLGFRAGNDVFQMYGILILTNQVGALKITSEWIKIQSFTL